MTRIQIQTIDASTLSFDFFFALNDAVARKLDKKKKREKKKKQSKSTDQF